ncbi:hypothetical protein ANN_10364 [Periplaneta americana]|uniref:Uncharacterized protein n=1 Tax=Periplaneta americana TaxID=6978 RepID=A0ABQ8TP63_PERAM|nr:hypothetical protein ANN_10364 [Periplaneta americana]
MTPLCTLLKSGSDVLVQTFTVLVYRPSFLGYVKVNVDICFSEKINTFASAHISQFTRSYDMIMFNGVANRFLVCIAASFIVYRRSNVYVSLIINTIWFYVFRLPWCIKGDAYRQLEELQLRFLDSRLDDKSFSTE